MSNFRDWTLNKILKRFSLSRNRLLPALQTWIDAKEDITDFEHNVLDYICNHLVDNILSWNEQELSMHAIGPIFTWVNFTSKKSNLFEERELVGVVDGESISGKPDGMIASGTGEPEIPYFCFHEYTSTTLSAGKKDSDPSGDPTGQCLAAMLVAQSKNEDNMPIYGVTISGENWRFLALVGKEYDISSSYSAGSKDIYDIFRILKHLKRIVAGRVGVEI